MVASNQSRYYLFPFPDANFTIFLSLILDLCHRIPIYMFWLFVLSLDPHHHILMSIILLVYDDLFLQILDLSCRFLIPVFSGLLCDSSLHRVDLQSWIFDCLFHDS
jgi:hypothetical protein